MCSLSKRKLSKSDSTEVTIAKQSASQIDSYEYVSKNIIPTLPVLQLWIEQTHQIHVQVSWLSEYCKKN